MKAPSRILMTGVAALLAHDRIRTRDQLTFDAAALVEAHRTVDAMGTAQGMRLQHAYRTHDGLQVRGVRTVDSTGAFLVGELERLDQTLHMPLAEVSYGRDIGMREDVSLADEVSSFTLSNFGSSGSLGLGNGIRNGKAWAGKDTNQINGVSVDIGKLAFPLRPWALELKYTILELESAAKVGRPVDDQKYQALKLKHQMDIDEQVYVGDATTQDTGLLNNALVTNVANLPNGAGGSPLWSLKTPQEILDDVNNLIVSVWTASAYKVMPNKIGLPPVQFGSISTRIVSTAGNESILSYIKKNNILKASGNGELEIVPMKWLVGAGAGGTIGTPGTVDRMVAYTQENQYVRYPMTMLQRTPVQYVSLFHATTYYCRLGVVEVVYPETVGYRDAL